LQDEFQVAQVVAGHQQCLARYRLGVDAGGFGMAEGIGLALVEHGHDAVIELADIHRALEQGADVGRLGGQEGHEFVELLCHTGFCLAQNASMFDVGCGTLQAIQAEQAQAQHIFTDFGTMTVECEFSCALQDRFALRGQLQVCNGVQCFGGNALAAAGFQIAGLERIAQSLGMLGECDDTGRVEVNVGQRGEKRLGHVRIDFGINHVELASSHCVKRNSLQLLDQCVLQIRDLCGFSAHARSIAAAVALRGSDRVLTLDAEHGGRFLLKDWNLPYCENCAAIQKPLMPIGFLSEPS